MQQLDCYYAVVSGRLDENKSLKQAMISGWFEEIGITIKEENIKVICEIRRGDNDNYFNYFLKTSLFEGIPFIK